MQFGYFPMETDTEIVSLFYIEDEVEYKSLKKALARGMLLTNINIERLAFTLNDWCVTSCAEDEDFDKAEEELKLLFACYAVLPASEVVQASLCNAALYYINGCGEYQQFIKVLACVAQLRAIANEKTAGDRFVREYAHALAITVSNHLGCDPPQNEQARLLCTELATFIEPYKRDDFIMPALLAWAERRFVMEAFERYSIPEMTRGLETLRTLVNIYKDNPLVAGEYAGACYRCLVVYQYEDADIEAEAFLPELIRIVDVYGDAYRKAQAILECNFPGYSPELLDYYLTESISKISARATERLTLERVQELYALVTNLTGDKPEIALPMYQETRREMMSHMAYIYGKRREYPKAMQTINELRQSLLDEPDDQQYSYADAMYNLVTSCSNEHPVAYQQQIQFLLGELAALAARTDGVHEHMRYAMALYNLSGRLEDVGALHMPVWNKLYDYAMLHPIGREMIDNVALEEMSLVGSAESIRDAVFHRERVKRICDHPLYSGMSCLVEKSAAADFNLLVVACKAKDLPLAEDMLQGLVQMAQSYAENVELHREIALRLARGANQLAGMYHAAEPIEHIYTRVKPMLLGYAQDEEIALRLVKVAHKLVVQMKDNGCKQDCRQIYEEVRHLPESEELTALEEISRKRKLLFGLLR